MRASFIVGCGEYQDSSISSLPFALADAREMEAVMRDPVLGASCQSQLLLNPARQELKQRLGAFLRGLNADDDFILYFAGHGRRLATGSWAFLCHDTKSASLSLTAFTYSDLRRLLNACRCRRGILIFDTCFARSASQLLRDLSPRGALSDVTPDKPQDGMVSIWSMGASDASELTFEKDGHGLLSGWLLKAIRCGGGLGQDEPVLDSAEAVRWIRNELKKAGMAEPLWPSFRSAGDLAGLYLSRNPCFDPTVPKASIVEPVISRDLEETTKTLVQELGLDTGSGTAPLAAGRLMEVARAFRESGKVPEGVRVRRASRIRVLWSTAWRIVGSTFVGALVGAFLYQLVHPVTGWIAGGIVLLFLISLLRNGLRILLNAGDHFLLFHEEGYVEACGGRDGIHFLALPWSVISGFRYGDETLETMELTLVVDLATLDAHYLSTPESRAKFPFKCEGTAFSLQYGDDSTGAYTWGGLSGSYEDLVWASELKQRRLTAGAPLEAPAPLSPHEPTFCLVGVASYSHMPSLVAPSSDVQAFRTFLKQVEHHGGVLELVNPSGNTLEETLHPFFEKAKGSVGVFYFAGHALSKEGELYLALSETHPERLEETGFPLSRFSEMLLEWRLQHLVLILDCCYSGLGGTSLGLTPATVSTFEDFWINEKSSLSILAAAGASDYALELGSAGVFTAALLKSARTLCAYESGRVSLGSLSASIATELASTGLGQRHHEFIGDVGQVLVVFQSRQPHTADPKEVRQHVNLGIAELERELTAELEAVIAKVRDQRPSPETRMSLHDGVFVAHTDRRSSIGCFTGLSGLVFGPIFLGGAWSVWQDSGFDFGLLILLGMGLMSIGVGVAYIWDLVSPPVRQYLILHSAGVALIVGDNHLIYPATEILNCDLRTTITKTNGAETDRHHWLNLSLRKGDTVSVIDSTDGWPFDCEKVLPLVRIYVSYYRSGIDGYAWSILSTRIGELVERGILKQRSAA